MGIKFSGIGHVAIRCKNFEEEYEFYTKVLGFKKILDIYDENGEAWITYLRVKKKQYIELFHKTESHPQENYIGKNEEVYRSPYKVIFEVWNRKDFFTRIKNDTNLEKLVDIENNLSNCLDDVKIIRDPEGNGYNLVSL